MEVGALWAALQSAEAKAKWFNEKAVIIDSGTGEQPPHPVETSKPASECDVALIVK